ncbi:MAG TPA: ABC transporter ATP-binding protein [bacterium]|nr:ABC transporter ATP-binding protein [bacterium]
MNPCIEIHGLKKSFNGTAAVDGLELLVQPGELFGMIGPDGAGKTTTLRILCGLWHADEGEARVLGHEVRTEAQRIRRLMGYMPQKFSLYPDLTVAENLRFFSDLFQVRADEREQRLQRLLAFSRLGPFAGRQAQALSGGMKQKLALSCTLIHTPQLLLLDEPTTGVDPVSRREFWDILNELRGEGVAILVTTPYMDEAAVCDRIAFIHKGRLLTVSRPADIPSLYQGKLLEIKSRRNREIGRRLTASGRFDSVQIFGDCIHASARVDPKMMAAWVAELAPEEKEHLRIKEIPAGIEDVFVALLK